MRDPVKICMHREKCTHTNVVMESYTDSTLRYVSTHFPGVSAVFTEFSTFSPICLHLNFQEFLPQSDSLLYVASSDRFFESVPHFTRVARRMHATSGNLAEKQAF